MIRFIFKRTVHNELMQYHEENHYTRDMDIPDLEDILTRGGSGNGGYETNGLVGVEIITPQGEGGGE